MILKKWSLDHYSKKIKLLLKRYQMKWKHLAETGFQARRKLIKSKVAQMKTKNTCINCAMLNCGVRFACEDNELEIPIQKIQENIENTATTAQVIEPNLVAKPDKPSKK